ncbi:MAG: hydantoinase/oxoprolinase family protein [Thermodesulfobacteriota bacterium]|nr:hydantoinase/oxoprolinase family protein [Thermodesulfobacteriota bacterium]
MKERNFVIGIDTGGTFTDVVVVDTDGNITLGKALTDYRDLKRGVIASLGSAAEEINISMEDLLKNAIFIGHGTTLGTNAVINRRFVKTGHITTKGHEDTTLIMKSAGRTDGLSEMEIRHQAICRKPEPIVPRYLIKGVVERIDCFGKVFLPLNLDQAKRIIDELIEDGVEAIGISLLWSFANPEHEKTIKQIIEDNYPHIYISSSSEVVPQIREYSRAMTVIIDAAIGRLMEDYINSLNKDLMDRGLKYPISIMQAYGGVTSSATARPISTIDSGPVGGVIGSVYLSKIIGCPNIITTDVGGTSFDISLITNGTWFFAKEPLVDRYRVQIPMIDIKTVGAGGGTIARIDPATGSLKVGPDSAGSNPGPVCYDLGGTEPTVTDADLILGYINPDYFFEGKMRLNKEKAHKALEEKIANPLKISVVEAAAGIYELTNIFMADNLRLAVIEKGYDPRDFVLFAFGGNGPMHAASYGRELGVKSVYIPPQASTFSAFGIASSDIVHAYKYTELHNMPGDLQKLNDTFLKMEKKALEDMANEGIKKDRVILERELDMRYRKQVHEVGIPVKSGKLTQTSISEIMDSWETRYELIYGKGSGFKEAGIQIVSFGLTAISRTPKPKIKKAEDPPVADVFPALKFSRDAFFKKYNDFVETSVYDYQKLRYGNIIEGPAIIEASTTTMIILPEQKARMDEYMNLVIENL